MAESKAGFEMSDKDNVKTEAVIVELKEFRMITNIKELPEGHGDGSSSQVVTGQRAIKVKGQGDIQICCLTLTPITLTIVVDCTNIINLYSCWVNSNSTNHYASY